MSNSKRGKKHYLDEKGKGKVRAPRIREDDGDKFNWKEVISGIEEIRLKEIEVTNLLNGVEEKGPE